ncbi:MAG: SDR family oxidoreductase [Chloroflexi bacterium]|nr:SDR family oxidoreductase [Chloroflexota bacterium]
MRLLVTGASGLLGLHLSWAAAGRYEVTGVTHANSLRDTPFEIISADLAQPDAVDRLLEQTEPEALVNCAALAYPDRCEDDPGRSYRLNAEFPGWLAAAARRAGIYLMHISTDAVFDGYRGGYREEDAPHPRNTYARHKLVGEQAVASAYPDALIARVIFYGWSISGKRSLAEWFHNNLIAGNPMRGFTDAIFCPLAAGDLAGLLLQMLECRLSGIYHVASAESISKYAFGVEIARRFGLDETLISPASVADSGLKAARAADLALCVDKLTQALGAPMPDQNQGLDRFYTEYQNGWKKTIEGLRIADF